ncbi:hypothetical protein GY45DRAFT_783674 [Cubamyces sp. BRFM 1775]|nr:hypothetical protein GY45DRAFT_783674 [Cubamyces sp. BRFM 1775]
MFPTYRYPFTLAAVATSGPFADVRNTTSILPRSPRRVTPSPGPENVQPRSRLPGATWNEDWDELKVLDDMGVEDPEEEEQLALFNSIPGFDDEWDEDENTPQPEVFIANAQSCLEDDWGPDPESDAADPPASTQWVPSVNDITRLGAVCPEEEEGRDRREKESDPSFSEDSGTEEDHSPEDDSDDESIVSEYEHSEEGGRSECEHGHGETQSPLDANEPRVSSDSSGSAFHERTPAVRRSARLAMAPKRSLAEDDLTDIENLSPRRTKRPRVSTLASKPREPCPGPKATDEKPGAPRLTIRLPSRPAKTRPIAHKKTGQTGSRSGRIPAWFLQRCVANTPTKILCGAEECNTMLDLKDLKRAHEHLRNHYEDGELEAAKILCAWQGCGELVSNRGNTGELLRHYDQVHLKLRYRCPGGCTDSKGKVRTWSRSDALTRHERTNPCDYLRDHPIPRTNSHAED